MKRLIYTQSSLDDLEVILDFIARDKPGAALMFAESLIAKCELIAQQPEIGMQREDLGASLRLFTYRGYGIYYRNRSDSIRIERFLHPSLDVGSQDFGN